MVIKIIYISKNTSMRCRASLRFTVTCHFGHRTCNSEPILLKIVSKDAHFLGVYYGMLNRFEPVFIGPVRGGFYRFLFSKGSNCNRSGPVQIGSVRSGFGLFPVHRTGPSNTSGCVLCKIEKTGPMNRLQPVLKATGCSRDTPKESAHFEPNLKRIGPKLLELWPKRYVMTKSDLEPHLIIAFFEF